MQNINTSIQINIYTENRVTETEVIAGESQEEGLTTNGASLIRRMYKGGGRKCLLWALRQTTARGPSLAG